MVRLFCLPYAGGSAMIFTKWRRYLDRSIEMRPLELPGRGKRYRERSYGDIQEAVDDLYRSLAGDLEQPYAFFGHSMGSMLAFELARKAGASGEREPLHLFLSARRAPHLTEDQPQIHNLPDEDFAAEIMRMGGTAAEIFANSELSSVFLPILRADYRLVETYKYCPDGRRLNGGLTVLHGRDDRCHTKEEILAWTDYARGVFACRDFPGGHFFINEYGEEIASLINDTLLG